MPVKVVSRGALTILAVLLAPQVCWPHFFERIIDLYTQPDGQENARVHSYAKAVLFTDGGARVYSAQVILGHTVRDSTENYEMFTARIVTEIGLANSTTWNDLPGKYFHCFDAAMAAHANAYNLHEGLTANQQCSGAPPTPFDRPEKYTPIILDLETDGFHLSGSVPSVSFDLDADGAPENTAWTSVGEDDAFLCMDRNGNGVIDDGRELFGSATPLLSGGTAKSGYAALVELDRPEAGGNADGQVDARDPAFDRLCAWVDSNRDGISQRQEIQRLDRVGVVAFEDRYKKIHKVDEFGNLFRYTSRVYMRSTGGAVISWPTFDVIFAVPLAGTYSALQ